MDRYIRMYLRFNNQSFLHKLSKDKYMKRVQKQSQKG